MGTDRYTRQYISYWKRKWVPEDEPNWSSLDFLEAGPSMLGSRMLATIAFLFSAFSICNSSAVIQPTFKFLSVLQIRISIIPLSPDAQGPRSSRRIPKLYFPLPEYASTMSHGPFLAFFFCAFLNFSLQFFSPQNFLFPPGISNIFLISCLPVHIFFSKWHSIQYRYSPPPPQRPQRGKGRGVVCSNIYIGTVLL